LAEKALHAKSKIKLTHRRRPSSASEAERRERLGLWVGDISLMPNGTLDGFNRFLDFDEVLSRVFRVTAIVFLRQKLRDVAAVRNFSISCCVKIFDLAQVQIV
jgi:hypothetical protein